VIIYGNFLEPSYAIGFGRAKKVKVKRLKVKV
jgi:hypothetical protein